MVLITLALSFTAGRRLTTLFSLPPVLPPRISMSLSVNSKRNRDLSKQCGAATVNARMRSKQRPAPPPAVFPLVRKRWTIPVSVAASRRSRPSSLPGRIGRSICAIGKLQTTTPSTLRWRLGVSRFEKQKSRDGRWAMGSAWSGLTVRIDKLLQLAVPGLRLKCSNLR